MKKAFLLLLIPALMFSINAGAGEIITDSLYSNVLKSTVKFNVYLPSGFGDSDSGYPFVYLLHGLTGDYNDWKVKGQMKPVADELIGTGEIKPMVVIMPNAGDQDTRNIQNGYFNVENWNYEDFFFQELMPFVEDKYRAIGDKDHRAVMGLSMGGGGCTVYSQRHPELFSSCYAMSAWLDNTGGEVGGDKSVRDCLTIVCESVHEHSAIDFVRNADEATIAKLKTVRWTIDCGDDDFILDYSIDLHRAMKAAGIHHEFRINNGVHNWEYWHIAIRKALPFANQSF